MTGCVNQSKRQQSSTDEKIINLVGTNLSATDLECVCHSSSPLLPTSSGCGLLVWQDRGLHIIHKYLSNCDVIITWIIMASPLHPPR